MDFDTIKFSYRLNGLLEENNMTQTDLSKKIDISNVTICRYLNGGRTPHIDVITRIANFFNVSIDFLLGRSDDRKIPSPIENIDYNIDLYMRKLFGLNNKTHISKKQMQKIDALLLANKDFIMFAR